MPWSKRGPLSQATRAKISTALKGRAFSLETRKRMSISARRRMYREARLRNTTLELLVQDELRRRGIQFETHPHIGRAIPDIVIGRLIVECDGAFWHSSPVRKAKDARRDAKLETLGYTVVRLTEAEILTDVSAAVDRIL